MFAGDGKGGAVFSKGYCTDGQGGSMCVRQWVLRGFDDE
jgi:hypothetical protein